jgi:homocysteine S-methyltransferase
MQTVVTRKPRYTNNPLVQKIGQANLPRWAACNPRRAARDCAVAVARFPQTVAIGVNCTPPALLLKLIGELRAATDKPVVVYPNSGEEWDAANRCWTGDGNAASFGEQAAKWFGAGAQIVGGCCRTRPAHIQQVAEQACKQH